MADGCLFYAERDPELAFDFNKRIRQAEEQIAEHPERYPFFPGAHLVRKCRVRRFPFSILYIDHPNYIWVVAIAHGSRRPGYWKERVRE